MGRPGPRQGTAVCVHTAMDMEQFDHKPIPPFFTEALNLCRIPSDSLVCQWRSAFGSEPETVRWGRIICPGDLLVTDGLTRSECVHSTASELLGPRVNLTFRWISQHIKSIGGGRKIWLIHTLVVG